MPHDVNLIATIAAGFGLAMVFGLLAARLRMPPLVGYLLAGIVIGPATPGFVADMGLAGQLAEIGVMLLMFGVGLHFSLDDLMAVRRVAVPGAIVQIAAATALGAGVALCWGWAPGAAVVFGLSLSVASTVVLLRALEAQGLLRSIHGQIAVGWLIVEDLVMVLVLVLLPAVAEVLAAGQGPVAASRGDIGSVIGITLAKVAAFVVLMLVVGRRVLPRILWWVARTGSRELFTLGVVAIAVGVAFGAAKLFDVSFALGAFFAGMMMRESEFSHRAAAESLPLRDAFAVLFFVSVGMLFDPAVVWREPGKVAAVVAIIMLGKSIAAVGLVLLLRYPLNTALIVAASLAQIGEFSFILAGLGVGLGLLPVEGQSLILAGALLSIAANASMFPLVGLFGQRIRRFFRAEHLPGEADPLARLPEGFDPAVLKGHAVIVGGGRVGRQIADALAEAGVAHVTVEHNRELVERLRREERVAVNGDATQSEVLGEARIGAAQVLVIAIPETLHVRQMVRQARRLNPDIAVVLRTHNAEEAALLRAEDYGEVFFAERELARGMTDFVMTLFRPRAAVPAGVG
jgi:CPA2 family monovalent cation:H+ antiporter-2